MKNFILFVLTLFFAIEFANAQCVISDTTTEFFSPDTLPCIVQGVAYNQVIQIAVPDSESLLQYGIPYPFPLYVDSVVIDSVSGFPTGITDSLNPANGHIPGGSRACTLLSGTTNDNTGSYALVYYGTITFSGTPYPPYFNGDTTISLQLLEMSPQSPIHSYIKVIAPGGNCDTVINTGVKTFSPVLNTSISIYPNPNNGAFDLDLNAGGRLNGELVLLDMTGRKVYSQYIDIMGVYHTSINVENCSKGLYTLQLRSADGFAAKSISIE